MSEDEFQEGEIINEEQEVQGDASNDEHSIHKQKIEPLQDNSIQNCYIDQQQHEKISNQQLQAEYITQSILQNQQEQINFENGPIGDKKKDQICNNQNLFNQGQSDNQLNLEQKNNYNKIDSDNQIIQLNPNNNQIQNEEDQKQLEFFENQGEKNQKIEQKSEPNAEQNQSQQDDFLQDQLQISSYQQKQQVLIQVDELEEIENKKLAQKELVENQQQNFFESQGNEQNEDSNIANNNIIEEQQQNNKIFRQSNKEQCEQEQVDQQKKSLHQNNDDEDFEEGEIIKLENENQNQNQNLSSDFQLIQTLQPSQQILNQNTFDGIKIQQNQQQINLQERQNIPDDDFEEGEIINEYSEQSHQNQQIIQDKPQYHEDGEEIIQENQNDITKVQYNENQDDEFEDGEIIQDTPIVEHKVNEDVDGDFIEGNIIEESQIQQKPIESQQQYYNISCLTNENFQELFNTLIQIYDVTPPRIQAYQQKEFQYNLQLQNIIPEETIQQLYLQENNNQYASDQLQELFLEQIKHNFDIWQNYTAYQNQLKDYDIKLEPINFEQIISAEKQSDPQLNNSPRVINLTLKNKAPKSMFFNDESFNSSPNKSNSPQKQIVKPTQPKVEIKLKQKSPPKIKVSTSPTTPRDVPVTSPVSVSNILDLIPDYSYLLSNTILVKE